MGFYLRKSLSFGPIRLNLSRSGLGASVGVKGARIGVGPRGNYVHLGRGGLYYRRTIGPPSQGVSGRPTSTPSPQAPNPEDPEEIRDCAAVSMMDSSATDLLRELNRVKKRRDRLPIVLVGGAVLMGWMLLAGFPGWLLTVAAGATAALSLYVRHLDLLKGTAILKYSLESTAAEEFSKLQALFKQIAACERVWHIDAAGRISDSKHSAGAKTNLKRTEIRPKLAKPPKVQCNLDVPSLVSGRATLYFFPDRLLVYDTGGVGAIPYGDLKVETVESRMVEHERVPRDSCQVSTTWQFVNKKGGPDRRFSNNRELPVMQYGAFGFSSSSGLNALFMCSRSEVLKSFNNVFPQTSSPQLPPPTTKNVERKKQPVLA